MSEVFAIVPPNVKVASERLRVAYDQTSEAVRLLPGPEVPEFAPIILSCLPAVPAPMNVDVATFQTSAARVPKSESERPEIDQTAVGIVANKELEAVRTVEFVLLLIVVIAEES
jgi:hypothetical protein